MPGEAAHKKLAFKQTVKVLLFDAKEMQLRKQSGRFFRSPGTASRGRQSLQSTQSGCALPQRRSKDRRRFGSSCIRLQSPCRSQWVALKDKILVELFCIQKNTRLASTYNIHNWCRARRGSERKDWEDFVVRACVCARVQSAQCQSTLVEGSVTTVGGDVWSWYFPKSLHDMQPLCHVFFFCLR